PGAAGPLPASCGSNLMEWDAVPGSSRNGSREYFGGNLRGITERLDHIRDLGANAILLTPINAAPSYHRYDTTDHRQLDPLLGTWDDLAELIAAVHARGMRIVFDTALNHVSQHHPWFERARRDPSAPERSWFTFHEDGSYRCWWGHAGLPELRLDDPRLVEELITGEDSVLAFWLKKGFDGVRLDCANDLSLQTCALISYTIKSRFPDAAVIGEVANYAVPWLKGLDAAQSYFFTTSLKALQHGGITSGQFQENLRLAYGGGAFRQFQMLSSHDIPRAHTEFAADEAFHLAARRLQFTLPGIPMLYYGEEFGLEGGRDPKNRATVPWESSASRLKAPMSQEIRRLAALRTTSPELRHGLWEPLCVDGRDGLIAFFRALPEAPERLTVVIWNLLDEARTVTLTIPWGWLFSELVLEEVTTRKRGISNGGLVPFALEARECSIWQLRADHKRNYSFFKDWRRPVRE
ncbi:MAG TPA: alpha-amylase family glycosyl hydrolase, partial [Candidatus Ozemobacteraceae bacterium]